MSKDRQILGEIGENLACEELKRRGYEILARRYRRRGGEIDVIASHGPTIVFIEVKTRAGDAFGTGVEAVSRVKQRRLTWVATDFLMRQRLMDRPCRFDVVSIDLSAQGAAIEVFENAFDGA